MVDFNDNSKAIDIAKSAVGITAGYAGYKLGLKCTTKLYSKYLTSALKAQGSLYNDEFLKASQKVLEESYLRPLGVKITHFTDDKKREFLESYKNMLERRYKKVPIKKLREHLINKPLKRMEMGQNDILSGLNATYRQSKNGKEVYVNTKKFAVAIPHELGHAKNYTNSKFMSKFFIKMKQQGIRLTPYILAISLLMPQREKGEKSNNLLTELGYGIKENAGKLTFLSLLPLLIEEGLASYNANKMMKGNISDKMLKHMNSLNTKAWGSYFVLVASMSLFTAGAVLIKDKISKAKLQKKTLQAT